MTSKRSDFIPERMNDQCGASKNAATTAAGDWFDARQAGARLAPHVLPDDTDVLLWMQTQEQQP